MITPPFVIFSPPRSGSTTLQRALNLLPLTWVAFEPMFDDIPLTPAAVTERVELILSDNSGFKHVFRETGYPFRPVHEATFEDMDANRALWLSLNEAILNFPGLRVVFLQRRGDFNRVVSDLIARATDVWGFADRPVSAEEPQQYKEAVSKSRLPAIDPTVVRWHLENMAGMLRHLRGAVVDNPVLDVWYEDLLGADVALAERLARFEAILDFLRIRVPRSFLRSRELGLLMRPSAKLNDTSVFERIPDFADLCHMFGVPVEPLEGATSKTGVGSSAASSPSESIVTLEEEARWSFRSAGRNLASVRFAADESPVVRIEITAVVGPARFDVQLNRLLAALPAGGRFELSFRARADRPRRIAVGVAQADEPWMNVGFYEEFDLGHEWQVVRRSFTAIAHDGPARVHFDVGGEAIPLELCEVELTRIDG